MIIANKIHKKFGRLQVLNNVSVTCNKDQCIGLIGPNGSGKTTFIKCILGMVVCDTGFITFREKNINKEWSYRNDIGYMPQIGKYPDNMMVGQLFDMMKDIRSHDTKLDEELIEKFQLKDIFQKRMRTLSGGTRQKVSAALAFLFDPTVLILDEPTAGLDPISSEILKEKIIKEKSNGKLIIISSHILSELDDMVTEVMYMEFGFLKFHKKIEALRADTGETKLSKVIATLMLQSK